MENEVASISLFDTILNKNNMIIILIVVITIIFFLYKYNYFSSSKKIVDDKDKETGQFFHMERSTQ